MPGQRRLTSETFLDVWRQAGTFQVQSATTTWLLSIARFKAISALRRRVDEELDDEASTALVDPADDPEAAVQKKDRSEILRKCLTKLSQRHRDIIDLVYYHEKSIEEVAEIVGISNKRGQDARVLRASGYRICSKSVAWSAFDGVARGWAGAGHDGEADGRGWFVI